MRPAVRLRSVCRCFRLLCKPPSLLRAQLLVSCRLGASNRRLASTAARSLCRAARAAAASASRSASRASCACRCFAASASALAPKAATVIAVCSESPAVSAALVSCWRVDLASAALRRASDSCIAAALAFISASASFAACEATAVAAASSASDVGPRTDLATGSPSPCSGVEFASRTTASGCWCTSSRRTLDGT